MVAEKLGIYEPRGMQIKLSGKFNLAKVYQVVADWFGRHHFEYHENRYKDKPCAYEGSTMDINMYGFYYKDEYFKYEIKVDFHLWGYYEKEVVINGKKQIQGQGKIQIDIMPELITDWKNRYPSSKLAKTRTEKFYAWLNNLLIIIKYNEILLKEVGFLDPLSQTLANELKIAMGMDSVR